MPTYTGGNPTVNNAALFTVDTNGAPTAVSSTNPVPTSGAAPVAANILDGFQSFTSTTGATTIITIPAGRTWVGTVGVSCAVGVAAASATAGQARAVITTAGTGVTPAAGTIMAVEAKCGANAATGMVGSQGDAQLAMPVTVIAPAGNTVTIQITTTVAGTAGIVDACAIGSLI